jgi:molecular chaperone HtpG
MLTNRDVLDADAELAIRLGFDAASRTIAVTDTGIGMNREELIQNLGTIAHSGVRAFMESLQTERRPSDVIGQFGVGFYSVFMVAEEVRVTSRSYRPEDMAWCWVSRGENMFTMEAADRAERGTRIEIKLKEEAAEYAQGFRLEQIVKKHSDFVAFPIYLVTTEDGRTKERVINQRTALWRQSPQEVTGDQYEEFYRQLTLGIEKPSLHLHLVTDAPVQIHAILYVPGKRESGFLRTRADYGLKLYSRKILIQEYNKDLLPNYFRFVEGIVDSEDIPLNISRESVQASLVMNRVGRVLRRRLGSALEEMAQERPEDYASFWKEFGVFIKEGVAVDPGSHDELVKLLRFHSSRNGDNLVSLSDYVKNMGENQQAIYYILGTDLATIAVSPHLDYFKEHNIEVLYLVDPIDSFMTIGLREFEGKPLQNIDDAELELPEVQGETPKDEPAREEISHLIERFKAVLGEQVTDVRQSKLLTGSACRLVSPAGGPAENIYRVQRLLNQEYQVPKKILELNPHHRLVQDMAHLVVQRPNESLIDPAIEQLYDNALLLEGLHPNPAGMVSRVQALIERAAALAQ